ncbi:hypothetical protein F5883DRAFT_554183 [Diaporthe sp. PMI_573]|nr:hypothetical protein F5883DRAFT_554183 [Diaporthaceae sp. PMI_573]
MKIQTLRKELDSIDASRPPSQPLTDSTEELPILMTRLAESVAQYDAAWVYGKIVDNTRPPDESSLDQLRLWLDQRSSGQVGTYRKREWHDFRILSSQQGPIEKVIKVLAPLTKIGRFVLRPFRSRRVQGDDLQFSRYEDQALSWVVGVVLLVGICIFLILPLAFLSYFDTNRIVRMALILVMCFLVSIFARIVEPDEARQIIFICVYSAVMSGFLSQGS